MAVYAMREPLEDEAGGFPSVYMVQGGIESSGYIKNRWSYRWFVEAAYNACEALEVKSSALTVPTTTRQTYKTGYRYHGRVIGSRR